MDQKYSTHSAPKLLTHNILLDVVNFAQNLLCTLRGSEAFLANGVYVVKLRSLSCMFHGTIPRAWWDINTYDIISNILAVKAEMKQILNNSKPGFTPSLTFRCFWHT